MTETKDNQYGERVGGATRLTPTLIQKFLRGSSREGFLQKALPRILFPPFLLFFFCCSCPLTAGGAQKKVEFFDIEELSSDVTLEGARFYINAVFGPTGLKGWILEDNLIISEVEKKSPADGIIHPADVIRKVNGTSLGENPMMTLGTAIAESDITGLLKLTIQRDGKQITNSLTLGKLPPQATTWPFNCAKSKLLLGKAARYLADNQNPGCFAQEQL